MRERKTVQWHITIKFRSSSWHNDSNILNCWVQRCVASWLVWSSNIYHTNRAIFFLLVPILLWCFMASCSKITAEKILLKSPMFLASDFQQLERAGLKVPKLGGSYEYVPCQHVRAVPQIIYGLCTASLLSS